MRKRSENDVPRDPAVVHATEQTTRLLVEAERLTHRLNVHLDHIQTLIEDRRDRE